MLSSSIFIRKHRQESQTEPNQMSCNEKREKFTCTSHYGHLTFHFHSFQNRIFYYFGFFFFLENKFNLCEYTCQTLLHVQQDSPFYYTEWSLTLRCLGRLLDWIKTFKTQLHENTLQIIPPIHVTSNFITSTAPMLSIQVTINSSV